MNRPGQPLRLTRRGERALAAAQVLGSLLILLAVFAAPTLERLA